MRPSRLALAAFSAAALSPARAASEPPSASPPPSALGHGEVHFITVEENVRLEVVDWGGTGRPLILLAGLGGHAHGFARFAPKLASSCHVFSITRRGFPPSSVPDSGYSADRLGDDVVAVIDALQLVRPVLAGHSLAGEELSSVATRHPDKVSGLVYLDAGYPYALYDEVHGDLNLDGLEAARDLERLQPGQAPSDVGPIIARLLHTLPLLEKELADRRAAVVAMPAPAARSAPPAAPEVPKAIQQIFAGERKYLALPLPVLAIFAEPHDLGGALRDNPVLRARIEEQDRARTENQAGAFERQVPTARVVRLPHASHFVFESNEADVLREMRAFIGRLPDP